MNSYKKLILKRALKGKKRAPRARKILFPSPIEREYKRKLQAILARARALVHQTLIPRLPVLVNEVARERGTRLDAYADTVNYLTENIGIEFQREYTPEEIQNLAQVTGKSVDYWNRRQMRGAIGTVIDIDLFGEEPWLASELGAFVAENVKLIESLAGDFFDDVESTTLRMIGEGVRWEAISDEIEKKYKVSESKANLIARDQMGKLQGQLTELRQRDVGITGYYWRGTGDERMRDSHREHMEASNNGKVFKWDDPPSDTGHPGEDYQCRCWAEPYFGNLLEE